MWIYNYQERIELPEAAREHVTSHMHCIDCEIQTGQMYSSFCARVFVVISACRLCLKIHRETKFCFSHRY